MSIPYQPYVVQERSIFRNVFFQAAIIAVVLTGLTYLLAFSVGWVTEPNWFEIAASAMNYAATFLSIKQKRFFYLIGIGASAIYAYVYGEAGLLASAVLSMYLTLSLIYGYLRWGKDKKSRPVHNLSWKWVPVYAVATAAFFAGAYFTVQALGGTFAFWDAAILVLTILAQFLLDNKVIQTWAVWTAVNVVGVLVYFNTELYFAAMQQLIFGVANLWGFLAWRRSMKVDEAKKRHPAYKTYVDIHSVEQDVDSNTTKVEYSLKVKKVKGHDYYSDNDGPLNGNTIQGQHIKR